MHRTKRGLIGIWTMKSIRGVTGQTANHEHEWTVAEIKGILRNLRKTKATERHSAEEILAWRKRKIDNWAKRRMKDIEESTKKQQEHKAALQRFNKKWKIFKPKHREQSTEENTTTTDDKTEKIDDGQRVLSPVHNHTFIHLRGVRADVLLDGVLPCSGFG